MSVDYTIYARPGEHDSIMKRIRAELRKDTHWVDKRELAPGESQELRAVLSAAKSLGLHVFRTESDYNRHKVTLGA